jgi:hypothetical protein
VWSSSTPASVSLGTDLSIEVVNKATVNLIGGAGKPEVYLIPQTTGFSNLTKPTSSVQQPSPTGFYLKFAYHPKDNASQKYIWYIPVADLLGDAAASITFEMERQYTFNIEILSSGRINFTAPAVSTYTDAQPAPGAVDVPKQSVVWAGSNIYWDGSKLTFAAQDDPQIATKKYYQGLFFKWGSLIGLSPKSGEWSATNAAYTATSTYTDLTTYANIPYANDFEVVTPFTDSILGRDYHEPSLYKGDICKYISDLGNAPGNYNWRMPTSSDFGVADDYANPSSAWSTRTVSLQDGTAATDTWGTFIGHGVVFAPTGHYATSGTKTMNLAGAIMTLWTSEANTTINSAKVGEKAGPEIGVSIASRGRGMGRPVRCVHD